MSSKPRLSQLGLIQLFVLKQLSLSPKSTHELRQAMDRMALWRDRPSFFRMMRRLIATGLVDKRDLDNPKKYSQAPLEYSITAAGHTLYVTAYGIIAMEDAR